MEKLLNKVYQLGSVPKEKDLQNLCAEWVKLNKKKQDISLNIEFINEIVDGLGDSCKVLDAFNSIKVFEYVCLVWADSSLDIKDNIISILFNLDASLNEKILCFFKSKKKLCVNNGKLNNLLAEAIKEFEEQ